MRRSLALTLATTLFASAMPLCAQPTDEEGPPLELLADNVRELPLTAHVEIAGVRDAGARLPGYVVFRVEAQVIETIKGPAQALIEYRETHEAPAAGPRVGSRVVVSLQHGADGTWFVPDNGYVFPASTKILDEARRAAGKPSP